MDNALNFLFGGFGMGFLVGVLAVGWFISTNDKTATTPAPKPTAPEPAAPAPVVIVLPAPEPQPTELWRAVSGAPLPWRNDRAALPAKHRLLEGR